MDRKNVNNVTTACQSFFRVALILIASPLSAEEAVIAIKGGDLYTITSGVLKKGTLLVKDGKISDIGHNIDIPKEAKVIDARGKVVMPGLVAATAEVGVIGYIGSNDSGKIADSLDPFDFNVSLALASGITTAFVSRGQPSGSDPIGGTNAAIKTVYGDLDSMLLKEPVAENVTIAGAQWMRRTSFRENLQKARIYLQKLEAQKASKDTNGKTEEPKKPSGIDPYVRLLRREMPARLQAGTASEILNVLELVDEFGIHMVIEDAVEAWIVAEEIAKRNAWVVITPRQKQPPNEDISGPSGSTLENAAILKKAGVKFAVVPPDASFTTWGVAGRDLMALPMEAAFAVSGGLDEQTALEAITLAAAEIIGVADQVGSLQVGKDADIIILDGHPFHYKTFVEMTLINGKILYEKHKSPFFAHITRDE